MLKIIDNKTIYQYVEHNPTSR